MRFITDEEEIKEEIKESVMILKKKLERFEKKNKKNGKLTQKEEEEKKGVIEMINELNAEMNDLKLKKKGGKKKSKKDGKTTQEEEEKKGANHPVLSGEPLECGQVPPMRKRSPGAICRKIGFHIWGFVDGKCQEFIRGSCGTKIPGFASKDECQRACGPKKIELKKGQDY